jgi:hypothetical protein
MNACPQVPLGFSTVPKIALNIPRKLEIIDIVGITWACSCIWARSNITFESILTCPWLPLKAEVPGNDSFVNFWVLSIHPTYVGCSTDFFQGSRTWCKGPWWLGCQVCASFSLKPVPTFSNTIEILRISWLVTVVRTSRSQWTKSYNSSPTIC